MSSISLIGAGNMASAIGSLALKGGNTVEVISRDPAKAEELAGELGDGATAGTWGATPSGDIVILAVLFESAVPIVAQYADALAGKIIVDITNPFDSSGTGLAIPSDTSVAEMLTEAAPASAHVIKAFNTLFRDVLAAGGPLDVFIAGDDARAKANMSAFIESLGLRALDVGQLAMARVLENAGLLQMGLMSHAVKHTNFALGISVFS
jgi:8-hydroxy-5-deazaflavin:NADPH oxidoreductase